MVMMMMMMMTGGYFCICFLGGVVVSLYFIEINKLIGIVVNNVAINANFDNCEASVRISRYLIKILVVHQNLPLYLQIIHD